VASHPSLVLVGAWGVPDLWSKGQRTKQSSCQTLRGEEPGARIQEPGGRETGCVEERGGKRWDNAPYSKTSVAEDRSRLL
jgi:hypothetical protein